MKVLIIGGGKVGYYLTKILMEHGHYPTIIEKDKKVCTKIANDLDIPIHCADGTEIEALEDAGIEKMDALISVSGKDEDNLIACQLAKELFRTRRTIARVNNPKNKLIMQRLGIDIAVSVTDSIVHLVERELDTSMIKQLVSLQSGEATISEILLPDDYRLHGKKLRELDLPQDAIIISISRKSEMMIPRGDTAIYSGDKILIMAKNTMLHKLKSILKLG